MKKVLVLTIFLVSLLGLSLRFSSLPAKIFGDKQKMGIKVFSLPEGADVLVDGVEVGKTPFEDSSLEKKEINLKLQLSDARWSGNIRLNEGTVTVVNRELSADESSSSGEVLYLTKGSGAKFISNPVGADIDVDGKNYGKIPASVELGSGEHMFTFAKSGYLKRSIKAVIPSGYQLGLVVDLAISDLDLTSITSPTITITPKLKVLSTPTNFLRVRDKPNLIGKEIERISPGEELILLEDLNAWFKVRLSDGKEGYVSSQYVEKINP